jgi:hypothetical protein
MTKPIAKRPIRNTLDTTGLKEKGDTRNNAPKLFSKTDENYSSRNVQNAAANFTVRRIRCDAKRVEKEGSDLL